MRHNPLGGLRTLPKRDRTAFWEPEAEHSEADVLFRYGYRLMEGDTGRHKLMIAPERESVGREGC